MGVKMILILAFIIMGSIEVLAEFFEIPTIIYMSKPCMMIILILLGTQVLLCYLITV